MRAADARGRTRIRDRLFTARVLLVNAREAIAHASLRVRNGVITAVGRRADFGLRPDCPETDLGDVALTPGLVNAHAHLTLTCCRGRFAPSPFTDWLGGMVKCRQRFPSTPEELARGIEEGLRELARNGTTAVGDVASDGLPLPFLETSGLRYVLFHEVIGMARPPYGDLLKGIEDRLSSLTPGPRGRLGLSSHAPYTVAEPLMAALRRRFHARRVPFAIHVAESRSEIHCLGRQRGRLAGMLRRMGFYPAPPGEAPVARSVLDFLRAGRNPSKRPARRTSAVFSEGGTRKLRLGVSALPRDLLVHGNFLTDAEVRALAREDRSTLVVCPGTREFHGVRSAIIARARRWGLPLALGTDSLASNTELNMWSEMRRVVSQAANLPAPGDRQSTSLPATEAFEAATVGGARALGLDGVVGELRPGCRADFIAVALDPSWRDPTVPFQPAPLLESWLAGASPPPIRGVWVDGEPVLDRAAMGEDAPFCP